MPLLQRIPYFIVFNFKGRRPLSSHLHPPNLFLFSPLSASEHSLVLKEIKVPLWSHNTCDFALQAQFGPAYHLPNTAVCAGAEGRDACDVSIYPNIQNPTGNMFFPYRLELF